MYYWILMAAVIAICAVSSLGQTSASEDQAVRSVIEKWDTGYRALDPKAMSATIADKYDLVSRFGQKFSINSREEYEKVWTWTFTSVYNGKPGPKHNVQSVRFVTDEIAIVHAMATRAEPVVLPDGKTVPPFTQLATFVLVKRNDGWKITSHNINNQFADPHKTEKEPWKTAAPAK